jgi:hypothetical protein
LPQWRPLSNYVLSSTQARDWKRTGDAALAELIVSPERAAWIMATYPPEETGRPGILVPHVPGEKQVQLDIERDEPEWRKTFSFEGNEDALADEGNVMAVAAD